MQLKLTVSPQAPSSVDSAVASAAAPAPLVTLTGTLMMNGSVRTVDASQISKACGVRGPIVDLAVVTADEGRELEALQTGWEVLLLSQPKPAPQSAASTPSTGGAAGVSAGSLSSHWPAAAQAQAAALIAKDASLPLLSTHSANLRGSVDSPTPILAATSAVLPTRGGVSESKHYAGAFEGKHEASAATVAPAAAAQQAAPANPLYVAVRRARAAPLAQPGPSPAEDDDDPIIDVLVVSRSPADSGRPWHDLLPRGYVVLERTRSGGDGSAALGAAGGDGSGRRFLAFLRRGAWLAGAAATAPPGAAPPPPPPQLLVDIDVLWLDEGATREAPLPGYRVIELTGQSQLPSAAISALPCPEKFAPRQDSAVLSSTVPGTSHQGGGSGAATAAAAVSRAPHSTAVAVRFDSRVEPPSLSNCPITGTYAGGAANGAPSSAPWIELSAVHAVSGAVFAGPLGTSHNAVGVVCTEAAKQTAHASATEDAPVEPAFLQHAGVADVGSFLGLNTTFEGGLGRHRAFGVAVPASAAALLASVAAGNHLTRAMQDALSLGSSPLPARDQGGASEPMYAMAVWKSDAGASGGGSGSDLSDLVPHVAHAVFAADGTSAVGAYHHPLPGRVYPWLLQAAHVLRVGFKRDVHTLFRQNRLVSAHTEAPPIPVAQTLHARLTLPLFAQVSSDVSRGVLDVASLLRPQFQPHLLTLDNRADCSRCGRRTERIAAAALVEAPRHLNVVLARMSYSHTHDRSLKRMAHVHLDPTLVLQVSGLMIQRGRGA